jgi:hypothetical protein
MNEGFRSLPEDVQKKILGKAMGGVMQRPLFRQMGGPAQPMPQDMMQQPMMPPAEPAAQAEMQGQAVGQEVAARTMGNIDAATDVKTAIDALRGNAAPLEARYQELANFVGERDASQTPESVLALTQPARVAGDTPMDQGMDQGLGGLMMQGAGNTPPQNFRQGGPVEVRGYQQAGEVKPDGGSTLTAIDPYLARATAARENILGTPEERAAQLARAQQQARSDAMFNLANFGLAFAGETQGNTVAERLANAATRSNVVGGFQQAGKDVAAARTLQEQQDQQMRLSALDSAEKALAAQEERGGRMALEELKIEADNQQLDKQLEAQIAAATTAFDRQKILNKAANSFEERIANLRISATAAEGTANRKLQERLQTAANNLQEKLVGLRADANLGNSVAMFNLQSAFDLEKMEMGQEFEIAKMNTMQGYETIAAEKQMAFTAAQNSLNRMVTRSEGAKNRNFQESQAEFNAELQKELKQMGLDEQATARALQHAQFLITSAQKDHQLLQGDEQLTLNAAIAGVDAQYKAEKLALEREAMNVVKLGSEAKSDQIKYITNAERLNQYANGELGDNTTTFEQAILDYMKPTETWDSALGKYVQGKSPDLAPRVKKAIQAGSPEFYNQLFGGGGIPAPDADGAASAATPAATPADDGPVNLNKDGPKVMTPEGKVNLDSPILDRAVPTIFKPEVDYSLAIGGSSFLPNIAKTGAEGFSEFGIGEGTGPEGQRLGQANTDLELLANRLFALTVDTSQDNRVLAATQKKLADEVKRIEPGGFFFKNDSDARAGFNAAAQSIALIIEENAARVPEYGGDAEGYDQKQVVKARATITRALPLLAEVLKFRDQFNLNVSGAQDRPTTDEGVDAAVNFLDNLVPK